jgi:hypothetical protein
VSATSRIARTPLKREEVDITRLALEVLEELQARDPQRQVEIEVEGGLPGVGDVTLLGRLRELALQGAQPAHGCRAA